MHAWDLELPMTTGLLASSSQDLVSYVEQALLRLEAASATLACPLEGKPPGTGASEEAGTPEAPLLHERPLPLP